MESSPMTLADMGLVLSLALGVAPELAAGLGVATFALASATLIILLLGRWSDAGTTASRIKRSGRRSVGGEETSLAIFLFEGEELVDATPAAHRLLRGIEPRGSDLAALLALLSRRVGSDLASRLRRLTPSERLRLPLIVGPGSLEIENLATGLRLTLDIPDAAQDAVEGADGLDRLRLDAALDELATLRSLAHDAPQLIWSLDASGDLSWANTAYLALADLVRPDLAHLAPEGAGPVWPANPLFEVPPGLGEGQADTRRLSLALPGLESPQWFDVTSVRRGGGHVHFATDTGNLVQAEAARHHFVQTLTKTFATLATGLAIFDRSRRLVLFNPAFVDLTGLPVPFLSTRPSVHDVLDRLRDAKILPEPRNYAAWRDDVAALEAAALQGQYLETWSLPDGQTWRVTGRPHPDGALAFLFEDISDEIALTRRFRAEMHTTQTVLDSLGEAMAAFSPSGTLTLSNAAYAALWDDPATPLSEPGIFGAMQRWELSCGPSSVWDRLREGGQASTRLPIEADLRTRSGVSLRIRAIPLAGGGTLVTFGALGLVRFNMSAGPIGGEQSRPAGWPSSALIGGASEQIVFAEVDEVMTPRPTRSAAFAAGPLSNSHVDGAAGFAEPGQTGILEAWVAAAITTRRAVGTDDHGRNRREASSHPEAALRATASHEAKVGGLGFATRRTLPLDGSRPSDLSDLRARFGVPA